MGQRGRPKAAYRRTESIEIRVDPAEKAAFRAAAHAEGLGLSGWARQLLRRSARYQPEPLEVPDAEPELAATS